MSDIYDTTTTADASHQSAGSVANALAADIVHHVFRTELGRAPSQTDLTFQIPFLTERKMAMSNFVAAIASTEEARSRQADGVTEVINAFGCSFDIPVGSSLALCLRSPYGYEPNVLPDFLRRCRPGMTVLDVGANWGVYALPAARLTGPGGKVFAIEANPDNARILLNNARLTGLQNLILLPAAVAQHFGTALLDASGPTNAGVVVPFGSGEQARQHRLVPTFPLDAIYQTVGRIDMLKLDVDGCEYPAMLGAQRLLAECRPTVFMEFNPSLWQAISGVGAKPVIEMFVSRSYTIDAMHLDGQQEAIGGTLDEIAVRVEAICEAGRDLIDLRFLPV